MFIRALLNELYYDYCISNAMYEKDGYVLVVYELALLCWLVEWSSLATMHLLVGVDKKSWMVILYNGHASVHM